VITPLPTVIADEQALATFRQGLTGPYAFDLLTQANGRLLVQLAVGVGKSEWLVQIIRHVLTSAVSPYDLVVVLVPRRDILRELQQRLGPLPCQPTILSPRPRQQCGSLNIAWERLEQQGCGALARDQLCGVCPLRSQCRWPQQYGAALHGVRLVLATQQHLLLNPGFVAMLKQQTGAKRPLVLLDESDLLLRCQERRIDHDDLQRFLLTQQAVRGQATTVTKAMNAWYERTAMIATASTPDLQGANWERLWFPNRWALDMQRTGRLRLGDGFRFLGYEVQQLGGSDRGSREVTADGDIRFAVTPSLGSDFMIFSGSIAGDLARYRLDPNHRQPALLSPFADLRFTHSGTKWFNLAVSSGAAKYFPSHARTILDFFAAKIAGNITAGKRTLLIARKKFLGLCRTYLLERLQALGFANATIVTDHRTAAASDDPATLPLINYGISGVNSFEHFDAAYCLTSYYVGAATIVQTVQDIDPTAERFPIVLDCRGQPPQRQARVLLPDQRETNLPRIAQGALVQKEADVVVQAVGRVRPFTKPREVITFQLGELPGVEYTANFTSLALARGYFNIPTRRASQLDKQRDQAWQLKTLGLTNRAIAEALKVSLATVKRYVKARRLTERASAIPAEVNE